MMLKFGSLLYDFYVTQLHVNIQWMGATLANIPLSRRFHIAWHWEVYTALHNTIKTYPCGIRYNNLIFLSNHDATEPVINNKKGMVILSRRVSVGVMRSTGPLFTKEYECHLEQNTFTLFFICNC